LLDLLPGDVAVVEDAALAVASLPSEVELAARVGPAVEVDPELQQGVDGVRAVADYVADDLLVAQVCTGLERVADVVLEGVVWTEDCGDPALGPVRRRVGSAPLGDEADTAVFPDPEGVEEAGDAASDDQEVEVMPIRQGLSPS
jgi:hypothetical protein